MDVGDPSNFVRILDLYRGDAEAIRRDVRGVRHGDDETRAAIREVHARTGYVMDPHTAVGYLGLRAVPREDGGPDVLLATAHPAKFRESVEPAIGAKVPVPDALAACLERESRAETIAADPEAVRDVLLAG
jgi:threonine synthase